MAFRIESSTIWIPSCTNLILVWFDSDNENCIVDHNFDHFQSIFDWKIDRSWWKDQNILLKDQNRQLKDRKSWLKDRKSQLKDWNSRFISKKSIYIEKVDRIWSFLILFWYKSNVAIYLWSEFESNRCDN